VHAVGELRGGNGLGGDFGRDAGEVVCVSAPEERERERESVRIRCGKREM
jgi:hypothetical protein